MEIYIQTAWKHPLINHFEFWTFNTIQCRIILCFQTCLNKRVSDELYCRRNTGQAHWIYAWNFDILHSFDTMCNADVQTWPTSIMWQDKSTYISSLWKGHRFNSNKSALDLRIWKGWWFENNLKGPWFEIMTSVDVDLSLSYIYASNFK